MELKLVKLLDLDGAPDVRTECSDLYYHVPSIAPYAYLHTIYAPVTVDALATFAAGLEIPDEWISFLKIQNGAEMFSNALSLYGVNDPHQLIDRSANYSQAAFSLLKVNGHSVLAGFPDYLQIGNYGYNAARLLLSRRDGLIRVVSRSGSETLASWPKLETYFSDELGRLSSLYSSSGILLVEKRLTVPSRSALQ